MQKNQLQTLQIILYESQARKNGTVGPGWCNFELWMPQPAEKRLESAQICRFSPAKAANVNFPADYHF